jgi:hypothetical protein
MNVFQGFTIVSHTYCRVCESAVEQFPEGFRDICLDCIDKAVSFKAFTNTLELGKRSKDVNNLLNYFAVK